MRLFLSHNKPVINLTFKVIKIFRQDLLTYHTGIVGRKPVVI